MNKKNLLGATALRSAAIGVAFAFTVPAYAQETPEAQAQDDCSAIQDPAQRDACAQSSNSEQAIESGNTPTTGQEVVVTGSRIRRPNLESVVPVTSIGGEEFYETGQTSIGDTLNELPALRSTFSQANSTRFLGTGGLNLLDLRGLGTQRTLVLVNGRRHVASNVLGNAVEVDTNTIPTDLIERVDVVTGGNSAIYGSDAIAGVVNFVLKDDYEGFQIRGQGGISKYGDAGQYYVSALAGRNFAEGRGNVAINLEYARQEDWYASQRGKCFSTVCGFVNVDTDADNQPDGEFDNVYLEDIRQPYYANGGSILVCCSFHDPSDPLIGGSGPYAGYFYNTFNFNPDGSLSQQTGQQVGISYIPAYIGGNGPTWRDGTQTGFSPKLNRYSANLLAHFEVSPAVVPFVEAKFVRTDSLSNASGPFFTSSIGEIYPTGHPLAGLGREAIFTDNPYLTPATASFINANYGSYFYLLRNYVELGNREEKARRDTFRIVGGVRGELGGPFNYEVSANYGQLKETTKILGNVNLQRYLLALDAVDDGTGNIVCRSQIDPTAAIPLLTNFDPAFAASQLSADVAACSPLNPFGEGNTSQAAKDYLLQDSLAKGKINEFVLNAFVSGDTSQFLNLPGGPIGFALGVEHRTYDVSYRQDDFTKAGMTFYNAIPDFEPPSFRVNEIFGEVRLPVLKDQFIHELTFTGAARYAKYKTFGGVWAYNAGAELSPIPDIRFRGNFSRAVRAPSLADAYTPLGTNFAPGFSDPCDNDNINDTANRAANCLADGVPVGFNYDYTSSLQFRSGGNPDLKPESSDSITLGGVLTPRFVPGFSLSVDYYNITVNDVITSPSAQQAVNACYDLTDINNQFCALFDRAGAGGGPRGEIPGRILETDLELIPLNYAKLKVRGIDVEAAYRRQIGNIGRFSTQFIWTHALQNDSNLDPTDPDFADQILQELGDPKDAFNWKSQLKTGKFTFGYEMRFLGKMVLNNYEDFFKKQGRAPENPDYASRKFYPTVFYHDVRAAVDVTPNFNFYVGVDDVTNRKPPLGLTGIGGFSSIYRNIGRFFYAGAVAKF